MMVAELLLLRKEPAALKVASIVWVPAIRKVVQLALPDSFSATASAVLVVLSTKVNVPVVTGTLLLETVTVNVVAVPYLVEVGALLKTVAVGALTGVTPARNAKQTSATRIAVAQVDRRSNGLHIALPFHWSEVLKFLKSSSSAREIPKRRLRECLDGRISASTQRSGWSTTEISRLLASPSIPLFQPEIWRQATYSRIARHSGIYTEQPFVWALWDWNRDRSTGQRRENEHPPGAIFHSSGGEWTSSR